MGLSSWIIRPETAGGSEDEVRQRYQVQMEIYGRALEAAAGKRVKETYLYLTDSGKIIRM